MMNTIVVILYLSIINILTAMDLPDCQEGRISFTSELRDAEVLCGGDNSATFLCQFEGSISRPEWLINSTRYVSINSELPPDHYYSSHSLTVANANDKNGTRYQCELLLFEDGVLCAYRSAIGQLIYRCPEGAFTLQSTPYYDLNGVALNRIQTVVSQLSSPADFYLISYSDSMANHGKVCHNDTIPASSCVNGTCIHTFHIDQSSCPDDTSITVTASSNTRAQFDFKAPKETKIDANNTFVDVKVSMSPEIITVNCTFLNQPVETSKSCGVVYGPNCEDLASNQGSIMTADTSSIVFDVNNDLTNHINSTCFLVTATNVTKTVKVEGSPYELRSFTESDDIHPMQNNLLIALICVIILIGFIFG